MTAPVTKVALAATASLLCATVLIGIFDARGIGPDKLLRDPAVEYSVPVYAGLISWLGICALVSASALTAFCASVTTAGRGVLLAVSAFSALLALDDALMLHEGALPRFTGLEEDVLFLVYGLALVAIAVAIRRDPPPAGATGILIPAAFLAVSVLLDTAGLGILPGDTVAAMEDLAKFAGFVAWAAYWGVASRSFLVGNGAYRTSVSDRIAPKARFGSDTIL